MSSGLYPPVERRSIGDIVIVVDISRSIGTKGLEQFSGEINAIANEAQPESIHAIYCDTAIQSEDEFALQRQSSCHKAGGGTDFVPPFKWVEENGIEPKSLIYLTDHYCNSFPPTPDYPVLWVTRLSKDGSLLGNTASPDC